MRIILVVVLMCPLWALAKTVVVVGGGLAGLTTAYELQKQAKAQKEKLNIEVYEAKDRPGGRVFTVLLNGKPAEMGGENFNDGGEALESRRLAKELGLKIIARKREKAAAYFFDAPTATSYDLETLKPYFPKISREELKSTLAELEKTSDNLGQVLDKFFAKHVVQDKDVMLKRAVIRRAVAESERNYEGTEIEKLSARYASGSLYYPLARYLPGMKGEPEPVDSVEGGNSKLVLALVKKIGARLHLSRPLTKLNSLGEKLELNFQGEKNPVIADVVVMAIPSKPYAKIEFGPSTIDAERLSLITSIGYGTHAKILLPGPKQVPFGFAYTEGAALWRRMDEPWHTIYLVGESGVMPGQKEFERGFALGQQAAPPGLKLTMKSPVVVPTKIFEKVHQPVSLSWALDPYIQGSYSHFTPHLKEQIEKPITVNSVEVLPLFAPIDNRIFFAGEHTTVDPDIRGTMEAAIASGVRAAAMIQKGL